MVPFGVRYVKTVNTFFWVVLAGIGGFFLVSFIIVGAFSPPQPNKALGLGLGGLFVSILCLLPAALLFFLNRSFTRSKPAAQTWQIIVSVLGLFIFPLGTVLYAIALYFMLFDAATKRFFLQEETPV